MQMEIDFDRYPAAKFGNARFDVPFNGPHGRLKKALRTVLRGFEQVECAYLLICSDPAWGDHPEPIVAVAPRVSTRELYLAWEPNIPEFGVVGFLHAVDNQFSAFASHAATPFYCPRETSRIPAPFSKPDLIEYARALLDDPGLTGTAAYMEAHRENYDHLPREQAEAARKAQQVWIDDTLHWLGMLRSGSAHAKAKAELLKYLTQDMPFGLALRTFSTFTTAGVGPLGTSRMWMHQRPAGELVSRFSPFPLIGIGNPLDPLPVPGIPLLECSEHWLLVVTSLLRVASQIYVLCDRLSSGVSSEFFAIQAAEREDDTMIVLPGPEQQKHYEQLYWGLEKRLDDPGPEYVPALKRKLATFGVAITTEEMTQILRHVRGQENAEGTSGDVG